MNHTRLQSSATHHLFFFMVDSTDTRFAAGKTGLTPTVVISKNGAAFASPSGAVSEVGNGWYKIAGNATDSNTLGELMIYATSAGADPSHTSYTIVAADPFAANLPANVTQWSGTNVATVDSAGYPKVTHKSGTGAGELNLSSGVVDANTTKWSGTAVAAVDTAGYPKVTIKSGTGTGEISLSSGLLTLTAAAYNAAADALLGRNVAGGSSTGRLVKEAFYFLRNKVAIASGTMTVYGTDDTTAAFTAAVTTAAGDPVSSVDPA